MAEATFLTRKQAAAACGCSEDTLRRDQRQGRLPHTRRSDDGVTLYAVADLVAAERLDPLMATGPVAEAVAQDAFDRELVLARQELAVAQARIAELSAWITRTEGEVAFLRSLLANGRVA